MSVSGAFQDNAFQSDAFQLGGGITLFPSSVQSTDLFAMSLGGKIEGLAIISGPSLYTSGGFIIDPIMVGLTSIDYAIATLSTDGYNFCIYFPHPGPKPASFAQIVALQNNIEVAQGTDLSNSFFRLLAIGV